MDNFLMSYMPYFIKRSDSFHKIKSVHMPNFDFFMKIMYRPPSRPNLRDYCNTRRSRRNIFFKIISCVILLSANGILWYSSYYINKTSIQYLQDLRDEMNKLIYNDKTGRADFALERQGARIVRITEDTENYGSTSTMFGLISCNPPRGPDLMIQTDSSPGNCWAFKGAKGGVIIKLFGKVFIDSVSIEHISQNLSPIGELNSAPKKFTVWGMKNDIERDQQLGQFTYDIRGKLIQIFYVTKINYAYEYLEVQFLSNHGNPNFTCVYRLRVHGTLNQPNK